MSTIRLHTIKSLLLLFIGAGFVLPVCAQQNNTYFMADQLLRERKYEQAYPLFEELHRESPAVHIFFEKATECLISLKQYDKAAALTEESLRHGHYTAQATLRLGEIYHIKGDTVRAFEVWDKLLTDNPGNFQIYLSLARILSDRRAFSRAIEVYRQAAQKFSNSSTVMTGLADTYMQAGNYEEAVQTYLDLVREDPDRTGFVQSTLLRFNDEYLYDIAILEIDDFLETLPDSHPAYRSLHQLELWLLLERRLYERALVSAKNYEGQQPQVTWSLYALGSRLLAEHKFKLAEEAFTFYVENDIETAKYPSMEELANVYIQWARYLSDYNLAYHSRRDSLYRKAYTTLQTLIGSAPYYQNRNEVLVTQAELSLDYLHDPVKAREYLTTLKKQTDSSYLARCAYLEGRIKLYQKEYARARIAFTRSHKQERIGAFAEKARYYLALTDFYAGDYEFAKIQLSALEDQSTSYYANDAVRLRVWIQEGIQADSTGAIITPFAKAVEFFSRGEPEEAIQKLHPVFRAGAYHPLTDEALLELSSNITPHSARFTYSMISHYLQGGGRNSPLRERLMWEKVRIADQVLTRHVTIAAGGPQPGDSLTTEEAFFAGTRAKQISLPSSKKQLITLYEDILMEYPQGFYAVFARNRIQELQKPQA